MQTVGLRSSRSISFEAGEYIKLNPLYMHHTCEERRGHQFHPDFQPDTPYLIQAIFYNPALDIYLHEIGDHLYYFVEDTFQPYLTEQHFN